MQEFQQAGGHEADRQKSQERVLELCTRTPENRFRPTWCNVWDVMVYVAGALRRTVKSCVALWVHLPSQTLQADQDNPDQADSAVTLDPAKSGITVAAKQTVTLDIP